MKDLLDYVLLGAKTIVENGVFWAPGEVFAEGPGGIAGPYLVDLLNIWIYGDLNAQGPSGVQGLIDSFPFFTLGSTIANTFKKWAFLSPEIVSIKQSPIDLKMSDGRIVLHSLSSRNPKVKVVWQYRKRV